MIRLKRIYELPRKDDGFRILVERLWPRGVSKERARVDLWLKEIAPSPPLRAWFGHEVKKWRGFQRRYESELQGNPALQQLRKLIREEKVITFLFASRDTEHNSATVLKRYIDSSG